MPVVPHRSAALRTYRLKGGCSADELMEHFCELRIPHNHTSHLSWPVVFATVFLSHLALQHLYFNSVKLLDTGAGGHLLSAPTGGKCQSRTAPHPPKGRVLPLHHILQIIGTS